MTQRMLLATLIGDSADATFAFFKTLTESNPVALDHFCSVISDNRLSLPIVYFCEWVDRWLMGDQVPGPDSKRGSKYEASCLTPTVAIAWAERCGDQFQEQRSFASRLREAATGWGTSTDRYAIVVIREVIELSTLDDDVEMSAKGIPSWWPAVKMNPRILSLPAESADTTITVHNESGFISNSDVC